MSDSPNPTFPNVVPSLREWRGGRGVFRLTPATRIVVGNAALAETAEALQQELMEICGQTLKVTSGPPSAGDVFLTLTAPDPQLGEQGYQLEIADRVTLSAGAEAGFFYGTRSLLQMLRQADDRSTLPQGLARDYPAYRERGLMLDAGRRYFQMDYLEQTIRRMAWLKLNVLHLHLSDWNGFRLVSDTYPGLASKEAYTKADLRRLQAVARRHHVTIVPEIDLPAHAKAITDYAPHLRFNCPSMDRGRWAGGEQGGWMLDVTRAEVRQWINALMNEFVPLFDGPYFHLGGDEYEFDPQKWACPELVEAMRAKGYPEPGDVFVEWINETGALVKSHRKQLQIWNWWECRDQKTSLWPDKDIVINAWVSDAEWFLQRGYTVMASPEDRLYLAPGLTEVIQEPKDYGVIHSDWLYEQWTPNAHPNLLGYKICVWADRVEAWPDAAFESVLEQPRAVLAERLWGGPRSNTLAEFDARVRRSAP